MIKCNQDHNKKKKVKSLEHLKTLAGTGHICIQTRHKK